MANKDLSFLTNSTSSRLEATALEKQKREAELQEMRRLRAEALASSSNPDWDNGSAPITDIEGWRNEQKNKAEEERRKKMEAAEGLHGYRGKEVGGSKNVKDRDNKIFSKWEGKGRVVGGEEAEEGVEVEIQEGEVISAEVTGESCVDVKGAVGKFEQGSGSSGSVDNHDAEKTDEQPFDEPEPAVEEETTEPTEALEVEKQETAVEANSTEEKEAVDGLIDMLHTTGTAVSYVDKEEEEEESAPTKETVEEVTEVAPEPPVEVEPEPVPDTEEEAPQPEPVPEIEEQAPQPEPQIEELTPEPEPEEPPAPVPPPTYTRTDVKFSFGLIVRSNHPTENFDENLRENETLRKCMASTSKILKKEMPSPPEIKEGEVGVDYASFPKAYYDPSLEPTVLSIEEDKKDSAEMMERGNKRTLVKASFPVFLQDVEGENSGKALLKETKSTVFKALRAAVSGGQFLR
ncbi:hypothetical protein ACHAWO_007526 [Cyclotella atomus]|uniref:Uncharacterized protein n=1 Tax=Cyclotella atomus TaxID=382360 RepID=A0ABD3N440_9STRA